jgi:hypothetical protein
VATVSIPTILRTHTGGEKSVEAKGATVAEVIDDLDSHTAACATGSSPTATCTASSTCTRRGRPVRRPAGAGEGQLDRTILPAVAGGMR